MWQYIAYYVTIYCLLCGNILPIKWQYIAYYVTIYSLLCDNILPNHIIFSLLLKFLCLCTGLTNNEKYLNNVEHPKAVKKKTRRKEKQDGRKRKTRRKRQY